MATMLFMRSNLTPRRGPLHYATEEELESDRQSLWRRKDISISGASIRAACLQADTAVLHGGWCFRPLGIMLASSPPTAVKQRQEPYCGKMGIKLKE